MTKLYISIHAPREGGDLFPWRNPVQWQLFQSTPPARGATDNPFSIVNIVVISIHAPREGGDDTNLAAYLFAFDISIHAPREGGDS